MAQTGDSYQSENTYGRDKRENLNRKNMAQTGNIYQSENTYGRDGREYLNRKNMAQTGDGRLLSIRKYLWPRRKRIFEQEKYGADRRQLLIRKYL
jgi:hypothetical protein